MINPTQLTNEQRKYLTRIQPEKTIDSLVDFCRIKNLDYNYAKGLILSDMFSEYMSYEKIPQWQYTTTKHIQEKIPGITLLTELLSGNTSRKTLQSKYPSEILGKEISVLKKEDIIAVQEDNIVLLKDSGIVRTYEARQQQYDTIKEKKSIADSEDIRWLITNKLVEKKEHADYKITVNDSLKNLHLGELVTSLTSEIILSGGEDVQFKKYDVHSDVPLLLCGSQSLLQKTAEEIRTIFLNMGFNEMSGKIVDSAFWNFDALFIPQDHPAREIQDTFYIDKKDETINPDLSAYIKRIEDIQKHVYETWDASVAQKMMLRTHTTSSTIHQLSTLNGQLGKYFSIDKVFRNETPDKTHLAEFHQIEGVVAAHDANVGLLIGYLSSFYNRLGFDKLKFKPTYNPYTEPSLEIYAYVDALDEYLEIGNSGVFRSEVTTPLGYKEDVQMIAWGLGLERLVMVKYKESRLSDIIGPSMRL